MHEIYGATSVRESQCTHTHTAVYIFAPVRGSSRDASAARTHGVAAARCVCNLRERAVKFQTNLSVLEFSLCMYVCATAILPAIFHLSASARIFKCLCTRAGVSASPGRFSLQTVYEI